jgi:effector-binding domain-containing protein
METLSTPDILIGQMRVITMAEQVFFYVSNQPTAMSELDRDLDVMMPKLQAAKVEAGISEAGPIVIRYCPVKKENDADETVLYLMEIGIPVTPGTKPAGEALLKMLPPFRCAALLYWGSLAHIGEAYGALAGAITKAGLSQTGEGREWHYHFAGDTSPNNVLGLHMGIV